MKKYYYAIDVGGTTIKAGIVDENNNLLFTDRVATEITQENNYLCGCILKVVKKLEEKSNLKISEAQGLGVGLPGEVDSQNGILCVANNLKLYDYHIIDELKKHINIPIKIANDANLAALAEYKIGAAQNYKNFVMLTLGTGVGGEFFVNGKPYSQYSPFSGEFGHIKIIGDRKLKCACGEYDCFETYASTLALVRQMKTAMLKNKNSKIWENYDENTVDGKAIFEYLNKDKTVDEVFNKFIEYLGTGIVSIINLLMPEVIILGGAISNRKEQLTKPLEQYVNSHIYAKNIKSCHIKIVTATLGGDAGIFGAKNLFNQEDL